MHDIKQDILTRISSVNMKDQMSRWRTMSLFWEFRKEGHEPIFNLKYEDTEKDGITYYSLRTLYMLFDDPTEYEFATTILGGWKHWQLVKKSGALLSRVDFEDWADEMEVKLASQAIRSMIKTAFTEGSKGTTAAKYVSEGKWKKDVKKAVGAPSRREKVVEKIDEEVEADIIRMSLVK